MKIINVYFWIFSLVALCVSTSFVLRENSRPSMFVAFKQDSYGLSTESKEVLDAIYKDIQTSNKKTNKDFFKEHRLLVTFQSCKDEFEKDKMIGYKRGLSVVAYFSSKYKIEKSRFVFSSSYDELGLNKCDEVGVFLYVTRP